MREAVLILYKKHKSLIKKNIMRIKNLKSLFIILLFVFVSCESSTEDFALNSEDIEALAEAEGEFENDDNGDDDNGDDDNGDEEEGSPVEDREIDCTVFDGVIVVRNGRAAGVRTISINDIDPSSVVWTIDGVQISPRTSRIVLLSDHVNVEESGTTIELCYSSFSPTCGKLEGCTTINF